MYTCTNILYDIRILRDCFILQRRQVILLQSFPRDNEVLAPGLCQTVLCRKHAFCSLSHISIHDQKCCNNTSENQENTAVDTVGHHSILCILHPAGLKHTIKIQWSWTYCFEFSDPCVRVVLSTSKRSKVLSAPQVSVKKIL